MSQVRRQSTSPSSIAILRWWETAFPDHPYGRPVFGTVDLLPRISIDDLKAYTRRILARETLKIAVVGDIDAETLSRLLDRTFGALPAMSELQPVADVNPARVGHHVFNQLMCRSRSCSSAVLASPAPIPISWRRLSSTMSLAMGLHRGSIATFARSADLHIRYPKACSG
jgi:hypothetical protein